MKGRLLPRETVRITSRTGRWEEHPNDYTRHKIRKNQRRATTARGVCYRRRRAAPGLARRNAKR